MVSLFGSLYPLFFCERSVANMHAMCVCVTVSVVAGGVHRRRRRGEEKDTLLCSTTYYLLLRSEEY